MPDVEELVIEGDNGSPDVCGIEFGPYPFNLGGVVRLSEETIIGLLLGGGGGGLLARVGGCGVLHSCWIMKLNIRIYIQIYCLMN